MNVYVIGALTHIGGGQHLLIRSYASAVEIVSHVIAIQPCQGNPIDVKSSVRCNGQFHSSFLWHFYHVPVVIPFRVVVMIQRAAYSLTAID